MDTTCHEVATVTGETPDGRVTVTIRRAEACQSCASKGACTALGGQTKDVVLVVNNTVGARAGDRVALTLAESSVIKASAVLYLLPAVLLVGGAAVGWLIGQHQGWAADPSAIAGSGVGLVVGLLAARLLGSRMGRSPAYTPHLTGIVGRVDLSSAPRG